MDAKRDQTSAAAADDETIAVLVETECRGPAPLVIAQQRAQDIALWRIALERKNDDFDRIVRGPDHLSEFFTRRWISARLLSMKKCPPEST